MWDDEESNGEQGSGKLGLRVPDPGGIDSDALRAFFDELDTVEFIASAEAQVGDKFRFGAEARMRDKDPDEWDCSELVEWSAHQAGVRMPDGSWNQFKHLHRAGTTTSIEEALETPGALLFRFGSDPLRTKGRPKGAHVAISLGDGRVVEATTGGVRIVERTEGWTHAGVIPGLEVSEDSPLFDTTGSAEQPEGAEDTEDTEPPSVGEGTTPSSENGTERGSDAELEEERGDNAVGIPTAEELEANPYLVEGAPRPQMAPADDLLDDTDVTRLARALSQGRAVILNADGRVQVDREARWDPMSQESEEFIELRLGELRQMLHAGLEIAIEPNGEFLAARSDGMMHVRGGPDGEVDSNEAAVITEHLNAGDRVSIHADGMIVLREVPGASAPSAQEGERRAREFVELLDSGKLAESLADGMMLTMGPEGSQFSPSPSFAEGGDLQVPGDPEARYETEPADKVPASSEDTRSDEETGSDEAPGQATGDSEAPTGNEAEGSDGTPGGGSGKDSEEPDQTWEEDLREQAGEARRFEQILSRAADSHRSMRDEFKLEKVRLEDRIAAIDDRTADVKGDMGRWDEDIKYADREIADLDRRISKLEDASGKADEISHLENLRTIAAEEREDLADLRRGVERELGELTDQKKALQSEAKEFDEQIESHSEMYDYMRSVSEGAERLSIKLLREAREAAGKDRPEHSGESDSDRAARLQQQAEREESIAMLASRAADANEAHADRLAIRIRTLENRVETEKAREQRLEAEVERFQAEVEESKDLAARLEQRAHDARRSGETDSADAYDRRAVAAKARAASAESSIRLREQENSRGGTTSEEAVVLYERQLGRLREEYQSVRAEVGELRELSTEYEQRAEGLEVMAHYADPSVPRAEDTDVVAGDAVSDHDGEADVPDDGDAPDEVDPGRPGAGSDEPDETSGDDDGWLDSGEADDDGGSAPTEMDGEEVISEPGRFTSATAIDELEDSLDELVSELGSESTSEFDDPLDEPAFDTEDELGAVTDFDEPVTDFDAGAAPEAFDDGPAGQV